MAHYTRNMYEATVLEMQFSGSFGEQRTYQQEQWFSNEEGIVELSGTTVNDVLAPIPVSTIWIASGSEFEHQPESSATQLRKRKLPKWANGGVVEHHASGQASSSQTQSVPAFTVIENKELCFRLFKIARAYGEYILEKHEVETGKMNRYHLSAVEKQGKWMVKKRRVLRGQLDMYPLVIDPSPPVFHKKYDVPLHERLEGWSLEQRRRCNGAIDKFYYHGKTQCRSFVEVSKYILYSCKRTLIPFRRERSQEEEAEAVEAMMILASKPVCDVNHQNRHVVDPPMENPIVVVGNEVENENPIRNENLMATPQPHDNCVEEALPNADTQNQEDDLAIVPMADSGEGRNDMPRESPPLALHDEDIFAYLPEIENLDFFAAVDDDDTFAALPDIEKLDF